MLYDKQPNSILNSIFQTNKGGQLRNYHCKGNIMKEPYNCDQ